MDADTLIAEVKLIIQDPSYDDDTILEYINDGIQEVAGIIDLQELRATDIVTATSSTNAVDLPDDYQKKCFAVIHVTDERRIDKPGKLYQYHKFIARHPVADTGSSVSDVAVTGRTLFYNPMPDDDEALRVEYFRYPADLLVGSNEPEGIPPHLHKRLFVNYASAKIFNMIEDGIEGSKANTDKHEGKFNSALNELHLFLGFADSEPEYIEDDFL